MEAVNIVLTIYSSIVIGVLIVFLWRIAYFYEHTSGQRVGHYLFVIPAVLLAAGVIWYLKHDGAFTGEPVGDLLLFSGGVLLCVLGAHLQGLMTG